MFDTSWDLLTSVADTLFDVFGNFITTLTTPINMLVSNVNIPIWLSTILTPLLNSNFGSLSIVQLMLQNGLVIFVAIVIVKFVIDILP